jgi:hypothetical protein
MTENFKSNKKSFMELIREVWNFDDESMEYLDKRLSDEWQPVPEFKELIGDGSHYEDQRISYDLNMADPTIQSFFERSDEAYNLFKSTFGYALKKLRTAYNLEINYSNFIENKAVFKKNITKIKKIFETVYAEDNALYERDSNRDSYSKEQCSKWIVKQFERIGSYKKSAKKLKFVISFNPMDWLMSSTGEDWSSCFNIANSGGGYQYCLGLPFLAGDKSRMLLYITDDSTKECMGITAHHYMTRTWCMLNEDGKFNIVKWYPNNTVGVEPVKAITGNNNFYSLDYFTKSKYDIDVLSTKKGAVIGVYLDMGKLTVIDDKLYTVGNEKTGQQLFTKNLITIDNRFSRHSFHFGEMQVARQFGLSRNGYCIPDWRKNNLNVDYFFSALKCSNCGSEDKGGFLINKGFYCYECYKDKAYTCEACGEQEIIEKGEKPYTIMSGGKLIKLCKSCWENREEYICSVCGDYHRDSMYKTEEGKHICSKCLSSHKQGYDICENCSKVSKNLIYIYNTFSKENQKLCKECSNEIEPFDTAIFGKYYCLEYHKMPRGVHSNE